MKSITARIIKNSGIANDCRLLMLDASEIAKKAQPGQFVALKISDQTDPLLRRPFSIYGVKGHYISVLYQVVGRGTEALARLDKDDKLEILGPLGNGFDVSSDTERHIVVAGGIGIAGVGFLAGFLQSAKTKFDLLVGAASKKHLYLTPALSKKAMISTDDGSSGHKGFVTELFSGQIATLRNKSTMVYACGPMKMLAALSEICKRNEIPVQCSVESRMACGIGICNGCVIKLADEEADGGFQYAKVCQDGPVFDGTKILFEG